MSSNFYEIISTKIIEKLNQLRDNKPISFYTDSEELTLAFSLAYFLLVEPMLVLIDKDDLNIDTRYNLNIDEKIADCLVRPGILMHNNREYLGNPMLIDSNEIYNTSWFLSALRNSISHSKIEEVDLNNKVIVFNNDNPLNDINVRINFYWFLNFMFDNPEKKRYLNKTYSHTIISDDLVSDYFKSKKIKQLNKDTLREALLLFKSSLLKIESDIPIKITEDELGIELKKCSELLGVLNSVNKGKINEIGFSFDEYQNFKEKVTDKFNEIGYDDFLYNKYLNLSIISKLLEKRLQKTSPTAKVTIELDVSSIDDDVNYMIKNKKIFNKKTLKEQIDCISDYTRERNFIINNVHFSDYIRTFINDYIVASHILNNCQKILTKKEIKKIFNGSGSDRNRIYDRILKIITEEIKAKGKCTTYDNSLFFKLQSFGYKKMKKEDIDFFGEDLPILMSIFSEMISEKTSSEYFANKYSSFWDKYTSKMRENGEPSDEVYATMIGYNIHLLYEKYEYLVYAKDLIEVTFLYALGINLYVANKESVFDSNDEIFDYSFVKSMNIDAYSVSAYNEYNEKREKLRRLNQSLKNRASVYQTNINNDKFPRDILTDIRIEIENLKKEIIDTKEYVVNRKLKEIGNTNLANETNTLRIANIIRNCLAHPGRIRIIDKQNDNLIIRLIDYNSDSNDENSFSAYIDTTIDDLIQFINNDVFNRIIHNDSIVQQEGIEDNEDKAKV